MWWTYHSAQVVPISSHTEPAQKPEKGLGATAVCTADSRLSSPGRPVRYLLLHFFDTFNSRISFAGRPVRYLYFLFFGTINSWISSPGLPVRYLLLFFLFQTTLMKVCRSSSSVPLFYFYSSGVRASLTCSSAYAQG